MKSFLDNRQNINNVPNGKGKVTAGSHFQPIAAAIRTSTLSGAGQSNAAAEEAANPNADSNAPKVEFIKDGDLVRQIIVTFGDQKVEIDCQY